MEILQTVPDELFSDCFGAEALGLDADVGSADAGQQDATSTAISLVLDDITDNVIFGFCLEIHRMCKKGVLFLEDTDSESTQQFKIVDTPGLDIFGQEMKKKALECVCPNCERLMAASRFAPHLEKCMGMGRCSSRVASRRIANNITKQEGSDNDSLPGDTEHDNDWGVFKRSRKLKKEKHPSSFRGRGRPPTKARPEIADDHHIDYQSVLLLGEEQRKSLLLTICGSLVPPSELPTPGSKQICNKLASKCNLHTEEMRQLARQRLLSEYKNKVSAQTAAAEEEGDIDIDTFDDLDNQTLRDALWERELTPTASPADSTSTVNSSGSRKGRGRKKKSKRRD